MRLFVASVVLVGLAAPAAAQGKGSGQYDERFVQYGALGAPITSSDPNLLRYGAGLGVHGRVTPKLSVVAEGRVMNATIRTAPSRSGSPVQTLDQGAHFEAALGISYTFN